jgi:hypothetical protein
MIKTAKLKNFAAYAQIIGVTIVKKQGDALADPE